MRADNKMISLTEAVLVEARIHRLLAHPLRHAIFKRLGEGPASPEQLARDLEEPKRRVCDQLEVLKKEGLAELLEKRPGPKGGWIHIYQARHLLLDTADWEALPEKSRATSTASNVRQLQGEMGRAVEAGLYHAHPHNVFIRRSMNVDDEGMKELDEIYVEAYEKSLTVQHRSAERTSRNGERTRRVITASVSFLAAPEDRPTRPG
jgi:DNA-binding transcriptional ArsR family regulator